MGKSDSVKALSRLLEAISENPYDISVHAQHIRLASDSGDGEQLDAAREMFTGFWAATEDVWLPILEAKEKSEDVNTLDGLQAVLSQYRLAEEDYLSIPVLKKHVDFLVNRVASFSEAQTSAENMEELLSLTWAALMDIAEKSGAHISQGYEVWDKVRDWQLELLEGASPEKKLLLVPQVEAFFTKRLGEVHSNNDATFQSYSSFVTNYKPPDEYEPILVAASKARSGAVKGYQRRETSETNLGMSGNSLEAFASYIAVEKRQRYPDLTVLSGIYERAIAEAAKRRFAGDAAAELALAQFWCGYLDNVRKGDFSTTFVLNSLQRAVRSAPGSGEVWARYIRFLESASAKVSEDQPEMDSVADVYAKALATGLVQRDVEQIVPLVLARAGYEKRQLETGGAVEEIFLSMIEIVEGGIKMVHQSSPTGDPRFRLEKYMSGIYSSLAESPESAAGVWEQAAKHYRSSYLAWTSYTEILEKQEKYVEAREVFREVSTKNLDWPEAIWEAWLTFEHLHGSLPDVQDCMDKIERAQQQVAARRAKQAQRVAYQAMQVAAEHAIPATQPAAVDQVQPLASVPQPENTPMEVDSTPDHGTSNKRKAEADTIETHKRVKIEPQPSALKRDRENCTVFIADLPSGASEDDLRALFKDCGSVREIKLTELPHALVATVEFADKESVPGALTKDKKRVREHEIAVHIAWQSTLYVTNFPEKLDDKAVRELFGEYGTIFDVRWPSKKFKGTRRFCYVQYTLPSSAKAALVLHEQELEPGLPINVYISNPERKKDRTDANANAKEVYVAGLSKFTSKADLERLFSTYGPVKDVRLATHDDGKPKGFAFVEFTEEKDAQAALSANNHELKSRRIAVTLADARVRARKGDAPDSGFGRKADARNRSLRIKHLPPGTQEGLLHQTIEKHSSALKRVEVFLDRNEALVEFENPAEAGRLLLLSKPIEFNGHPLTFVEETVERAGAVRQGPSTKGGFLVPRAAGSRAKAGLGKPRAAAPASTAGGTLSSSSSSAAVGKGQDHFRSMLG